MHPINLCLEDNFLADDQGYRST